MNKVNSVDIEIELEDLSAYGMIIDTQSNL